MCKYMHKPAVKIRPYTICMAELYAYLPDFLLYGENQPLKVDKILEVLQFVIIWTCQKMTCQKYNPMDNSIKNIVWFCKQFESTETTDMLIENTKKSANKKNNKHKHKNDADEESV